ncbi:MAG: helix-hairpin-helix domain-containing protein, partial [Bacteroidota bacterium]|nr:helix-hairpin-helix domain-containing protein [Bacteroidota bacterium]MDX5431312.1 helix-hairpin-helix domain-containing protein [Bacteroidota bacterium]MDX5470050.1 helix-hairpin-helix domain-containing protein [Bacteroidota bacterium]
MNKHLQRWMREHFSLSAKERKGMLVLAGILFFVVMFRLAIPLLFPPAELHLSVLPFSTEAEPTHAHYDDRRDLEKEKVLFPFDPNTITQSEIMQLGFSPKQASAWINYRKAGARFYEKEDLLKLFFMDEKRYLELEPWIIIEAFDPQTSRNQKTRQKPE